MDSLNPEVARLVQARERRRRELAALPFSRKVRMVVQLQQRVAPILRARGRVVHPWKMQEGD